MKAVVIIRIEIQFSAFHRQKNEMSFKLHLILA